MAAIIEVNNIEDTIKRFRNGEVGIIPSDTIMASVHWCRKKQWKESTK